MEEHLLSFANAGHSQKVQSLLLNHPELDVNWTDKNHWTALHCASVRGHIEVVKLLLAHLAINVNVNQESLHSLGPRPRLFE